MSTTKIPFGDAAGQLITECSLDELERMIDIIDAKLCDDPNGQYSTKNKRWLDEALAVFKRRKANGDTAARQPAQVAPSVALAKVPVGAIRDAAAATQALAEARELGHLISPAPAVGNLPEGCSILVSALMIDVKRETYPVRGAGGDDDKDTGTGDRGLGKVALDRIGGALGIDWDPVLSRRLDDGSHPHYCRAKAVGRVRNLDCTWRTFQDEKELDLRDGAPIVEGILAREAKKRKKQGNDYRGDGGAGDIAQKRQHIQSLCMTEARERAIRTLGVRVSYAQEELKKPFIIVQLVFDGRSENPEAAAYFRERIADTFLGASQKLYGGAPAPAQLNAGHPPPPIEAQVIELPESDEDDSNWFGATIPATGTGGLY